MLGWSKSPSNFSSLMSTGHVKHQRLATIQTSPSEAPRTLTQLSTELSDRNTPALEPANKYVLETATADLLELRQLLWRDLAVIQPEALKIKLELALSIPLPGTSR